MSDRCRPESSHWRHNDHDGVSNHQPHSCLLNRLFRRRSKKTSKLHVTGFCVGNSPGPVNSPHKRPVTRKMFPFDDVIVILTIGAVNVRILTWFVKDISPQEQDRKSGYTMLGSSKKGDSITPELYVLTPPQVTHPWEGPAHAQDTPGSFAEEKNESSCKNATKFPLWR